MRELVRKTLGLYRYLLCGVLDLLNPVDAPRREKPLYLNFVFHAEEVANTRTYHKFLDFVSGFHQYTGVKSTACILTPQCPLVTAQLEKFSVSEAEYSRRVRELANYAEVGYHGHFFKTAGDPKEAHAIFKRVPQEEFRQLWQQHGIVPIGPLNYDLEAIEGQFEEEMQWFAREEIVPKVYVAGWWLMTEDIALLLEKHGIEVDCSLRKGHEGLFGGKYLPDDAFPPRGQPFALPPTKEVIEIQSIFYPVEHPRQTRRYLRQTLAFEPQRPLFAVFPSHEGEILNYGRELWANIRALSKMSQVKWLSLSEMGKMARRVAGGER